MRATIALIACLCALPAGAQNLRGQWRVDMPKDPDYAAAVLVDEAGRVTLDSPLDHGRPAQFRGYIQKQPVGVKIVLTNGAKVVFLYCAEELSHRLQCYAVREDGNSDTVILSRVGEGPRSLMSARP